MMRRHLVAAALVLAAAARIHAGPVGGSPVTLRLGGRIVSSRAAAAAGTIAALALDLHGDAASTRRWLGVTDARTIPRQDPIAGQNLVEALLPLGARLRVSGPTRLLARLRAAPAGSRVVLEGMTFAGDPNLLLTRVEVAAPPPTRAP